MPSVRTLKETGNLFLDFRFRGQRCREYTLLPDTPANHKKLQKLLDRIEESIAAGTFDYARFFPGSKKAAQFIATPPVLPQPQYGVLAASQANSSAVPAKTHPIFKEFAEVWVGECAVAWRRTQRRTIDDILKAHLLPNFGSKVVSGTNLASLPTVLLSQMKAKFSSTKKSHAK